MKDKRVRYGLYAVIFFGLFSHVMPYLYHRSLWVDEARLASSIVNRTLWTLTASPLDAGQSAPVGYLYVVKLLSLAFGTGEAALRLWSLLSFFGCVIVFHRILKQVVKTDYRLYYTALLAVLPVYIYYGNELKPYMSDCFFVLLAIWLYGLYQERCCGLGALTAAYALLLWFSFAAVFYIAGGMILIGLGMLRESVRDEDGRKRFLRALPYCFLVLISFIANYVFWLSATSGNAEGQGYWALVRFPLIPTGLSDLRLMAQIFSQMLMPFGIFRLIAVLLSVSKAVRCVRRRYVSPMDLHILAGTVLLLAASWLGFYPIQDRLVLFVSVTLLLFAVSELEELAGRLLRRQGRLPGLLLRGGCLLLLLVCMLGDLRYWRPGGVYMVGSETAGSLNYLAEHKTDEDMIYVRNEAIPAFLYEKNYPWGDVDLVYETPLVKDDCILGQPTFAYDYQVAYSYEGKTVEEAVLEDAALIEAYDSVYIYTSHEIAEKKEDTQALLNVLKRSGTVETVSCYYETYLYHYRKGQTGEERK